MTIHDRFDVTKELGRGLHLPFRKRREPPHVPMNHEDDHLWALTGKLCWSCRRESTAPGRSAANERICEQCGARIDYPGWPRQTAEPAAVGW